MACHNDTYLLSITGLLEQILYYRLAPAFYGSLATNDNLPVTDSMSSQQRSLGFVYDLKGAEVTTWLLIEVGMVYNYPIYGLTLWMTKIRNGINPMANLIKGFEIHEFYINPMTSTIKGLGTF